MTVMGLEIPGLRAAARDKKLKDSALRLLDEGFRPLLRETWNLAPGKTGPRPGYERVAPEVRNLYRQYLDWWQELSVLPDGTVTDVWAQQLTEFRDRYDALRAQVKAVHSQRGDTVTRSKPGALFFEPPKPDESWEDWLDRATVGTGGALVGVVLALGVVGVLLLSSNVRGARA